MGTNVGTNVGTKSKTMLLYFSFMEGVYYKIAF
ncbi:hypothetical protein PSOS111911_10730 [Pseudoalteromonas ostreae]